MENTFILFIGFIFGVVLGSLVKALADRSVKKLSFFGRSHCDYCKKKLAWFDLFPIFSFLSTKGRCRYCNKKLSLEYLLVEVLMGLLVSLVFFITIPPEVFRNPEILLNLNSFSILTYINLIFKTFVVSVLVIVLLTDIKTGLIPDRITYPSIIIAFFSLLFISSYKTFLLFQSLTGSLVGKYLLPPYSNYFYIHSFISPESMFSPFFFGIISALVLAVFFASLIIVTKGRGMGGGDLKLAIFIGLGFGFPNSLLVLMLAFLAGSIAGILLLVFGKKKFGQTIPFGPFLTLGGIITLFWGEKILNWYLNLNFT